MISYKTRIWLKYSQRSVIKRGYVRNAASRQLLVPRSSFPVMRFIVRSVKVTDPTFQHPTQTYVELWHKLLMRNLLSDSAGVTCALKLRLLNSIPLPKYKLFSCVLDFNR